MPGSKNQTARYYLIDECLRNRTKKYWSKQELIDKICDRLDIRIKERSLDYDIENMRHSDQLGYYAPIQYSKKDYGYYYTDSDYSIRNLPLNEEDLKTLEFATTILSQYKDVSTLNDFKGVVDKVVSVVNQIKKNTNDALFPFVDFEKAPYSKGTELLDSLIDSVKAKKVLQVTHQKFSDIEPKKHIIHPYLLKEYRNRWYLLGLNQEEDKIKTLGLDRIIEIENCNKKFIPPKNFSPDLYFKNTFGISFENKPVERVILSFNPEQGKYLQTQPMHETQFVISNTSKEFLIGLELIPNYELKEKILGYGANVKVIQPKSLREEIAKQIYKSYKHYFEK